MVGILVAAGCIVILLAVIGLIAFMMMRKKDRSRGRDGAARSNTTEGESPPPYMVYDAATGGVSGHMNGGLPQADPIPYKEGPPPSYTSGPPSLVGSDPPSLPMAPPFQADTSGDTGYDNPTYKVPDNDRRF